VLAGARATAASLGAEWLVAEIDALATIARLTLADADRAAGEAVGERGSPFDLTPRELEVLAMLARGLTNREIGEALYMAEKTASVHVSRILGKLGVRSRTQAATLALRAGLVGDSRSEHVPSGRG
jgi:DNA-binding NarL/FixJ family response regulator